MAVKYRNPVAVGAPAMEASSLVLVLISGLNRFLRLHCLLAHIVGDAWKFALIRTDRVKVLGKSDEIQRSQRFPHLLGRRINHRDQISGTHLLPALRLDGA